jgi:hypothetical protein
MTPVSKELADVHSVYSPKKYRDAMHIIGIDMY